MRIVLLGATGFVGHHLLPVLSAKGHECIVLCRNAERCRELRLVPGVQVRQLDMHDPDVLAKQFEGADAVINMVGILNESGRNGAGFHKVHVQLVENIIEACRRTGVRRMVQVSALNAGKGESHYLASKGKAEELIRQADHLDSTIVQPSVIFGYGDAFFNRFATLVKWIPLMPLACPKARLQPVWVGDVVMAIGKILEDQETIGTSCVLVGPNEYNLRELVEWTAASTGRKCKVIGLPDALSRMQGFLMDFVPFKPFSTDNYKSLQTDSTSTENALWRLGVEPHTLECIVSAYLNGSLHQRRLNGFRKQASQD